jgi:hypothetical protein
VRDAIPTLTLEIFLLVDMHMQELMNNKAPRLTTLPEHIYPSAIVLSVHTTCYKCSWFHGRH